MQVSQQPGGFKATTPIQTVGPRLEMPLSDATRNALFAAVVIVCGYGLVGTLDYQIAVADENERRARAKPTGKLLTESEARLWSKRCMALGKQIFATQADGGRWKIQCVNAEVRT